MFFQLYAPAPPLDRFIENFWLYRGYSPSHQKERILQDGTFKAVFNLAQDEFRIYEPWQASAFKRYSGAMVSRPSCVPFVTDSAEEAHILGVNFRIGGALPFLGHIANEAGGSHVDLVDLWGREVDELHHRLVHEPESNQQFRLMERALLRRLSREERHHPAALVALRSLGEAGPASRTGAIAKQVGLSQRRLITICKQEIGIAPKSFARVRRFQRALAITRRNAVPNWPALALECGYCDQSHMIRDFVAFSGFSPADYLSRKKALTARGVRVKHNHVPLID